MDNMRRLLATDEITRLKARYFRGIDTDDGDLVRELLAEDCVLDYRGCCTDPTTKRDFIPAMNVVLQGRSSWKSGSLSSRGIVSVHQGHNFELEFTSDTTAKGIWSMTDRLYFPPGGAFSLMTGYGYYFETYENFGQAWLLKTTRITRIRVEAT
jgi:SnoaL-like domain